MKNYESHTGLSRGAPVVNLPNIPIIGSTTMNIVSKEEGVINYYFNLGTNRVKATEVVRENVEFRDVNITDAIIIGTIITSGSAAGYSAGRAAACLQYYMSAGQMPGYPRLWP